MKNREIQSLRGFACMLLLLYHVVGATQFMGLRIQDEWIRVLTDQLAAVRMPLFAFLAGAMSGYSSVTGMQLVSNKFKGLIVPMLTVGSIFALVQNWVPGSNHQVQDWYLIHVVPVAHYWFLESLFLIFCLLALLERVYPLNSAVRWFTAFSASAMLYLFHPGFIWFGVSGAIYLLPYFLLGLGFTRYGWTKLSHRTWRGYSLIASGLILLAIQVSEGGPLNRFSFAMLVAGLLFGAGLWLRPVRGIWLARVGDHSYAIFLFHVFFTAATRISLMRLGVQSIGLHVLAGVLFGVLGPVALQQAIVRSPILRQWLLGMYPRGDHRTVAPLSRLEA